jgi:hypothetical protein
MAGYITDEKLQTSRGLIKDAEVKNIFGYNEAVGADFVPVWEGSTYTFPANAINMIIQSNSASDTSVVIRIIGLDDNYDIVANNYTLNGTSNVAITPPLRRINDVITVSGNAQGNVFIKNNTSTYAEIRAGDGRNQAAIFTVPRGYEFHLYRIDAFSATALANKYITFRNRAILSNNVSLRVAQTTFINQMNIQRRYPFKYTEKTDVIFQAKSSSQTNEVGIFAEGVLIKLPRTAPLATE